MRITDSPFWWEQVIVNLHISEEENAADPDAAIRWRRRVGGLLDYYHREAA
jgi:hypothetical protein